MASDSSGDDGFGVVRAKVRQAVQQLLWRDRYLLQHDIREEAVSHHLAVYLEHLFPTFDVDCEYDKSGEGRKRSSTTGRDIRPDIIVHRRGLNDHNLLVIEVKKKPCIDEADSSKVKDCMHEYGYSWAICISLEADWARLEWQGHGVSAIGLGAPSWDIIEEFGRDE